MEISGTIRDATRQGARILKVAAGLAPPQSPSDVRYVQLARGALSAVGLRGAGIAVAVVSVPLTLGHFGPERYGAWMAISSVVGWLSVSDLGVANHLTNALAAAYGRRDAGAARAAVSTAIAVLAAVAAALLFAGVAVWSVVPWSSVFNVRSPAAVAEVGNAMLAAFVAFCCGLPLVVLERIYTAYQRGATANAWAAAGTVLTLAAIVVVTRAQGGLVSLVAATMGTGLLVKLVNAAWLFARERADLRPRTSLVTRAGALAFVGRGAEFFVVQIGALVLFSTDNLVIANVLGAERVASYSICWQVFTLPTLLHTLGFYYLWAAYGEALARGDRPWVVSAFRHSLVLGTVFAALVAGALLAAAPALIRFWAGPAAVPSPGVVAWMAAWSLVLAPATAISCLLNAAGATRVQAILGIAVAPANIGLSIVFARTYGSAGVIAATVITYVAVVTVPTAVAAARVLRGLEERSLEAPR